MKKNDVRKQLEIGMSVFLSEGKTITKLPAQKVRKSRMPKQAEEPQIDVVYLPTALRKKYFVE